jgi:hypothetical protein
MRHTRRRLTSAPTSRSRRSVGVEDFFLKSQEWMFYFFGSTGGRCVQHVSVDATLPFKNQVNVGAKKYSAASYPRNVGLV